MPAIWICRDENGIIDAAHLAEYTSRAEFDDWKKQGRKPELVVAESVTLGKTLPPNVHVVSAASS